MVPTVASAWHIIFNILDLADILHKVGHFTMDNASNNATFMTHLAILLRERGITGFDAKKNYIHCFAHIINLCLQAVIKQMEKEDANITYSDSDTDDDSTDLDCSGDDVEEVISPQAH
ncbi:hypothetical protein C8R44DRAFT_894553 [Mycena epipterygia]|nr:hypothetical protein C8R44DRAFT_894553 [Mycena epipterygia]